MSEAGWAALARTALELEVAADPASLAVVRHVAGGLATALGFDPSGVADLRLAVTEVCASFVRARPPHREDRCLEVRAALGAGGLHVRVLDPISPPPGPGTGPPMPLLSVLARQVELRHAAGGGMEVELTFVLPAS